MQRASIKVLVVGLVVGLCALAAGSWNRQTSALELATQQGGITVTPANLKLDLPAGELQTSTTFTVTNHYETPVALNFSFEADPQTPTTDVKKAADQLVLSTTELNLASGATATQTVTLFDGDGLAPGSQQLNLVVRQLNEGTSSVGVVSSIRLPLVVIKENGALTRLTLGSLTGPSLTIGLPSVISSTLRNTGNMIAIPHGNITVTGPGGKVLSQGTVNVASAAVTPSNNITFNTNMTTLDNALLPGIYHVQFSYGLGGDYQPQMVAISFFYIAWWHIVLLVALIAGTYYVVRSIRQSKRSGRTKKRPARPVLAGRDTA